MSAVIIENSPYTFSPVDFGGLLKRPDDDEFFEFCQINGDWRFERDKDGEIVIMTPTGWESGNKNAKISAQLSIWAEKDGRGQSADSSAGYKLPDGAILSPDASWILNERLEQVSPEARKRFLPLAPDFVIELRSESDPLTRLLSKMTEYIENGTSLAWLIDPLESKAYIFSRDEVQTLRKPLSLSGEPFMPGFILDLKDIW
jgi:Uma2 family endonuclease